MVTVERVRVQEMSGRSNANVVASHFSFSPFTIPEKKSTVREMKTGTYEQRMDEFERNV